MRRRTRIVLIAAGSIAGIILLVSLAAILVLQSGWFREQVRRRIVAEVEKATGGRVELGSFGMDWRQLRAEVHNFVIHGTEPAGGAPLFRADTVAVGLKIVSILKKQVDIEYLDDSPPASLPDSLPGWPHQRARAEGPARRQAGRGNDSGFGYPALQPERRHFRVEGRGKTPFDARGRDLRAQFSYDLAGPRYSGAVAVHPLDFRWGEFQPVPLGVDLALALERNRVRVSSAILDTGRSRVELAGTMDDFANPRGQFRLPRAGVARRGGPDSQRVVAAERRSAVGGARDLRSDRSTPPQATCTHPVWISDSGRPACSTSGRTGR